jgi:mRNA interferase MazF
VRRGDIWLVSGRDYAGKPRPAIILQGDAFPAMESVTICPLTTDATVAPLARTPIEPVDGTGLRERLFAMADKVTTIPVKKVGERIGAVPADVMRVVDRTILVFLGLHEV